MRTVRQLAEFINTIMPYLNYGALGVIVALFVMGMIVPKNLYLEVIKERDTWKEAFFDSEHSRENDRAALKIANDRADAAVETAAITKQLLDELNEHDARRRGVR